MAFDISFAQASFAAALLVAGFGTFVACTPPNPNSSSTPETGDFLSRLNLTKKHGTSVMMAPMLLLGIHTLILALCYPNISQPFLGHGAENGLDTDLITWSPATAIPLALILFLGVPLRLISYSSLGKNFTFALSKPDRLHTSGIHGYMQHPSYTGVVVLIMSNIALLARIDGAMSCWLPRQLHDLLQAVEPTTLLVILSVVFFGVWTRVKQEEQMLQAEFGAQWDKWHAETARFIPWLF